MFQDLYGMYFREQDKHLFPLNIYILGLSFDVDCNCDSRFSFVEV